MKLSRIHLRKIIAEAGIVPKDVLDIFLKGKHVGEFDVHIAPDNLESMDPHESYGLGYLKGQDIQCDHPDWNSACVKNDHEDHTTPGEALGIGYAIGRDDDKSIGKLIDDFSGEAIAKIAALRGASAFGTSLDEFDNIDRSILTKAYLLLLKLARNRNKLI